MDRRAQSPRFTSALRPSILLPASRLELESHSDAMDGLSKPLGGLPRVKSKSALTTCATRAPLCANISNSWMVGSQLLYSSTPNFISGVEGIGDNDLLRAILVFANREPVERQCHCAGVELD